MRHLFLILFLFFIAGCSNSDKEVKVETNYDKAKHVAVYIQALKYYTIFEEAKKTGSFTLSYHGSKSTYLVTRW